MSTDDKPTPAPSLDELRPEKGTLLQLHSINDEYNGMLVEYHGTQKETGKFLVVPFKIDVDGTEEGEVDDDAKFIRVKPKVCRRPDLKPLKMRRLLASLATQMKSSCDLSNSSDETKFKGLLEKDPCCVMAFMALGLRKSHCTMPAQVPPPPC